MQRDVKGNPGEVMSALLSWGQSKGLEIPLDSVTEEEKREQLSYEACRSW